MKNDLMKKVGELLDLAGVDQEVVKSVTEKLADEDVVLEGEEEMQEEGRVEEAACPIKYEEPEAEAEDEKKAPVDPKANEGGYNAVAEDFETLKREYAKLVAEKILDEAAEEAAIEEAEEEAEAEEEVDVQEALTVLLSLVKEAYEQTSAMKSDFDALKEEYAKLVAEKVIEEGCDDEIEMEAKGDEEDKAERAKEEKKVKEVEAQEDEEKADEDKAEGKEEKAEKEEEKAKKHKAEEKEEEKDEDKDYEKAHESLEETADQIAEGVTEITEEAIEVTPKRVKIAKAYSAFSNISEAVEEEIKEEKKTSKAFTLFPNL